MKNLENLGNSKNLENFVIFENLKNLTNLTYLENFKKILNLENFMFGKLKWKIPLDVRNSISGKSKSESSERKWADLDEPHIETISVFTEVCCFQKVANWS